MLLQIRSRSVPGNRFSEQPTVNSRPPIRPTPRMKIAEPTMTATRIGATAEGLEAMRPVCTANRLEGAGIVSGRVLSWPREAGSV